MKPRKQCHPESSQRLREHEEGLHRSKQTGSQHQDGCGQELPSPAKKLSPVNKYSQRKNSFLHGSLTGDKPHLRAGPKLSNSQHKRNSMVFTGDFLFPFSTCIVLSGLCFFFFFF